MQQRNYGPRKNYQINISPVRVIDSDGTMLGVKPTQEALQLARERGLDLVEISPLAKPPVCKILDYSKYLYEQEKKNKDARKKQHGGELKELRIKPRIATHDLETKTKQMEEFIRKGDKVRLTVVFHGRENQHRDLGHQLLMQVKEKFVPIALTDGGVQTLGNRMSITLTPKGNVPPPPQQHQPAQPKPQPQQQPAQQPQPQEARTGITTSETGIK